MTGKQTDRGKQSDFTSQAVSAPELVLQFRKSGYAIVREVFSPHMINELKTEFLHTYNSHLDAVHKDDALTVGDKRYKTSLVLQAPFDSMDLLANSVLLPILRQILDEDLVLASVVCVTSLPGASNQHVHRDHPYLFGTPIDRLLPSYAVKLVIPLVPMNEITGTTRVWPESQHSSDSTALESTSVDPLLMPGDCMLTDYKLLHQGLANGSEQARPVLFLSYARHWFQDEQNFQKQAHILASEKTQKRLQEKDNSLFSRVQVG